MSLQATSKCRGSVEDDLVLVWPSAAASSRFPGLFSQSGSEATTDWPLAQKQKMIELLRRWGLRLFLQTTLVDEDTAIQSRMIHGKEWFSNLFPKQNIWHFWWRLFHGTRCSESDWVRLVAVELSEIGSFVCHCTNICYICLSTRKNTSDQNLQVSSPNVFVVDEVICRMYLPTSFWYFTVVFDSVYHCQASVDCRRNHPLSMAPNLHSSCVLLFCANMDAHQVNISLEYWGNCGLLPNLWFVLQTSSWPEGKINVVIAVSQRETWSISFNAHILFHFAHIVACAEENFLC